MAEATDLKSVKCGFESHWGHRSSARPASVRHNKGMTITLENRLEDVLARIESAAARAGRDPASITLLLATKTRTPEVIAEALEHLSGRGYAVAVGENRAQEIAKHDEQALAPYRHVPRHFIGRLQSNKARDVVEFAEMIHSVDRDSIAEALERRCELAGVTREVLIQVNTSGEESKGGYAPDAAQIAEVVARLRERGLIVPRGLMTIGANTTDEDLIRASLARLRELRDELADENLSELSMGMSNDLEIAVEEGATILRVGSAIFGPRP